MDTLLPVLGSDLLVHVEEKKVQNGLEGLRTVLRLTLMVHVTRHVARAMSPAQGWASTQGQFLVSCNRSHPTSKRSQDSLTRLL